MTMVTSEHPVAVVSEGGRPRTFTDERCFEATSRILSARGTMGLSLAAVARDVGCTGPALSIRFGSRMGLLEAYFQWSTKREAERFREVRARYTSPLEALRARFRLPLDDRPEDFESSPAHFNGLTMLIEAQNDERFRKSVLARTMAFQEELASLLQEAIDAGELHGCDPNELAHLLLSSMIGGVTIWSLTKDVPFPQEVLRLIDAGILPYRTGSAA
jgi:AcrR family transcriptional regulator